MSSGAPDLGGDAGTSRVPALSVIVPVYNAATDLVECLDSICGQSFTDIEVIAVNDASTDDSRALLERYAAGEPRVSILDQPTNQGLGMARNAGMARARAPYLLFVDSDDTLAPGALQAVADSVNRSDPPDVVMFGYEWRYPDGRRVPDPKNATMLSHRAPLTTQQRIPLLKIIPVAWNKAYRREYLESHDFRFPTGMYEDVPWTYPVIMSAGTLLTIDRVCYSYRQRPGVGILATAGWGHFDLVTQYDRVFDYLDAHPELEPWRRPMLDRIAWHIPTVLETSTRIRAEDRRAYFEAASAAIRRHRPPGYLPPGRLGLKVWLIEHGGYQVFRTAQLLNRIRRQLDRTGDAAR
jgi:CRISPR system Cascade subunit CasB